MRQYSWDPAHLTKYRNAALKFTNTIRAALNLEPLEDLLPGAISEATACTVTKSIEAHGLYSSTGYDAVNVFDEEVDEGDFCMLSGKGHGRSYVLNGEDGYSEDHTHIEPLHTFKVPADVQRFLKAFDAEYYEDLVSTSPFEEV